MNQDTRDETTHEIRTLMDDAGPAILKCCEMAMAEGDLSESILVVKVTPAGLICVGLCDRVLIAGAPPSDLSPPQIERLKAKPNRDEILVMLFGKQTRGVGRVTKTQIEEALAKKAKGAN